MITVSLCMIVKNDEAVIERCLKSVSGIVDEIIIIDCHSTDRTRELASQFTNNIHFLDHYDTNSIKHSFEYATMDYILWLYPCDILLENDRVKFHELKQAIEPDIDGVSMNYRNLFDTNYPDKKTRLFKKACSYSFTDDECDDLIVSGKMIDSDATISNIPFSNHTKNNLIAYEKMLSNSILFTPRDLFYYAKVLNNDGQYNKAIKYFLKFLRTGQKYDEHNILACNYLANCYHHLQIKELENSWGLQSFQFGKPQPEICCRLGYYFLQNNKFDSAIFWYKEATSYQHTDRFIEYNHSCATWLPHLQLAVCYDRIGEYQLANEHNEIAYDYYPTHPSILSNREYFANIVKGS